MRGIYLERTGPDGSRFSVHLTGRGRLLMAGGQFDQDSYPPEMSPPFEATGLRCRSCYRATTDMPQVLWMLVDRLRRRAMRTAYRRKTRRR